MRKVDYCQLHTTATTTIILNSFLFTKLNLGSSRNYFLMDRTGQEGEFESGVTINSKFKPFDLKHPSSSQDLGFISRLCLCLCPYLFLLECLNSIFVSLLSAHSSIFPFPDDYWPGLQKITCTVEWWINIDDDTVYKYTNRKKLLSSILSQLCISVFSFLQ